jgi:Tripartite tricarboxylate transporter TctB family
MVINQNLLRALLLIVVALAFGLGARRYSLGSFANIGPGFFPLLISGVLLGTGLISLVQSRLAEPTPMRFELRGFAVILGSFCGFTVVSHLINMTAGIIFLVFCAALASSPFAWLRSVKVAAALVVIALMMQKLLGLELPLY